MTGRKSITAGLLAALLLQPVISSPARAQYIDEDVFIDLSEQGEAAWEEAGAALDRKDLSSACTSFIKAANLWAQANNDAPAEFETANLHDTTKAREMANLVCKSANGTTPFARTDARTDAAFNAQVRDVQKGTWSAAENSRLAVSFYEEGNRPAACRQARYAADELQRVAGIMRANPELESVFENPAQIFENASTAAENRDKIYCVGIPE